MYKEKVRLLSTILEDLDAISVFRKYFDDNASLKLEEFIKVISKEGYSITDFSGLSKIKTRDLIARMLPERDPLKNKDICKYLLHMYDYRACKKCVQILSIKDFRPNISKSDGLNGQCKSCQSSATAATQPQRQAVYKAVGLQRIMPWTNLEEISEFYSKCPIGYHVDHIIPLQNVNVSGLHVLDNLQYLTALENIQKSNKFDAGSAVNNPLS